MLINNYNQLIDSFDIIKDENEYAADEWMTTYIENAPKTKMGKEGLDFKNAACFIAEMAYKFGKEDAVLKDYTKWIVLDPDGAELRVGGKVQFDISSVPGWEHRESEIYTISGFDFRDGKCQYVNVETSNGSEAVNWKYCRAYSDSWDKWGKDLRYDFLNCGYYDDEELKQMVIKYKERAIQLGQLNESNKNWA